MLKQIVYHLDQHAPLPDYQSAYHANYGCETAHLELHNEILWSLERKQVLAFCVMDLSVSAAFDTVEHDLLLTVLRARFGLADSAIQWVESYLRPCGIRVRVNDYISSVRETPFAVPQGSCLGP